jgi:hypothetical protein
MNRFPILCIHKLRQQNLYSAGYCSSYLGKLFLWIHFIVRLLSTQSFPKCFLPSEFPTKIFSSSLPYMLRILADWLNLFFSMKDSCFSDHHHGVYAPSFSICIEITTKLDNRCPHTPSKDAPCHVIRDIFIYSGSNFNITTTKTRSFENANG